MAPKTQFTPDVPLPLTSEPAARVFLATPPDAPEAEVNRACARALELDPYAVEVLYVLGQRAKTAEERLEYFHRASQAAAHKPHRIVAEIMPSIRVGMAEALMHYGRLSDAVELLRPALEENRADHVEAHCYVIDLMLQLGWDDELQPVAESYVQISGVASFALALLEYRRHGATPHANQLLMEADDEYPGVAVILCGLQNPNASDEDDDELEFERYVAQFLLPGVRDTPGAVKWIRETLDDSIQDHLEQSDGPNSERDLPAAAERQPKKRSNWDLTVTHISEGEQSKWLAAIIWNAQLLQMEFYDHEPQEPELVQLLLSAVITPLSGQAHRPGKLRVATSAHEQALTAMCSRLGVTLDVTPPSKKLTSFLQQVTEQISASREPGDEAIAVSDEQIGSLPCSGDVWLLGTFSPPMFIQSGPTPSRGWLTQVADADDERILYVNVEESQPTPEQLWQGLCHLMLHPEKGPAQRPERVIVDAECWNDRFADFPEVVFERGDARVSDFFTRLVAGMLEYQGPIKPALRDQVGVDDDMLSAFYETAARFYRLSPWKMVGADRFFEVSCDAWPNPRWAACITGQLGQERGMTIYDNPKDALAFLHSAGTKLSKLNSAAAHFFEAHEAIPVDVWNIERCGWKVADFEAIPFVARIRSGKTLIAATAEDVQVLTAVMQHAVQFIEQPPGKDFAVAHQGTHLRMRWLS